jgi:hypothetical protein
MFKVVLLVILSINNGDLIEAYTQGYKDMRSCQEAGLSLPAAPHGVQLRWGCSKTGVEEVEAKASK